MPFKTTADVPEHVPADKREQWLEVWNRVYQQVLDGGGSQDEAEQRAFAAANALLEEKKTEAHYSYIETVVAAEPSKRGSGLFEFVMLEAGLADVVDPQTGARYDFRPEFVTKAAPAFQGVHAYADHPKGPVGSIRDVVGFWSEVRAEDGGQRMVGLLNILESEEAIGRKLEAAAAAGRPDLVGASIHAVVRGELEQRGTQKVFVPTEVVTSMPRSCDLVPVPGAKGRMLRAVASANLHELKKEFLRQPAFNPQAGGTKETGPEGPGKTKEETSMKERIQKMLEAIKAWGLVARAAQLQAELSAIPEEEKRFDRVFEVFVECSNGAYAKLQATAGDAILLDRQKQQELVDKVLAAEKASKVAASQSLLQARLADSRLPVPAQRLVEKRMAGQEFTPEQLDQEITQVREAFAQMVPEGRVTYPVLNLGLNQGDKLQIALDRMFGLTHDALGGELPKDVPAFRGLREAYIAFTGDSEVSGRADQKRLTAIFNNAGFPAALANTMTRRLMKDYAAVDYRWRDVASSIVAVENFKTQERVRVGYFGDLATVDPEAADYAELAAYTDEKVSYAVIQKGNLVTVTRKAILNDDLNTLQKVIGRLGRAAARTLAKRVWNKVIANDAYDVDTLAMFHATHSNLQTVALSVPELNAAAQKLFKQTEKDSAERLGLAAWLLAVPIELREVAYAINQSEIYNTGPGIEEANPWFHYFGDRNERIVVSPLFTDANDWYLFANPADVDIIEVGFLQGRQEPEFFLADAVTAEQVFVADKIRYKVRHEYEAEILDFRGAVKAVVA